MSKISTDMTMNIAEKVKMFLASRIPMGKKIGSTKDTIKDTTKGGGPPKAARPPLWGLPKAAPFMEA